MYRKPRYIATCVYAVQFVLLGNMAGNAISCVAHFLRATNPARYSINIQLQPEAALPAPPPDGLTKGLAIGVITVNCLIHFYWPRFGGKYLMTAFAVLKILLLVLVIIGGIAAGAGKGYNNPEKKNFYGEAWKRDDAGHMPGGWAAALLAVSSTTRGFCERIRSR